MIRIFLIASILVLPMTANAAKGVSKKALPKWTIDKLCGERARAEMIEDWHSVAIIVEEISTRDIMVAECKKIGESYLIKLGEKNREKNSSKLSDGAEDVFNRAIKTTNEAYREQMIEAALLIACDEESTFEVKEVGDYSARMVPKKYGNVVHLITNYWVPLFGGYIVAFRAASVVSPGLCEPKNQERIVELFVRPVY